MRRVDLFLCLLFLHLDVMPGAAAAVGSLKLACVRLKVTTAALKRRIRVFKDFAGPVIISHLQLSYF